MTAVWSHIDTLRAAEAVREASRRDAVQRSFARTAEEAGRGLDNLAEIRADLDELNAQLAGYQERMSDRSK